MLFAESALDVGERARSWHASSGVDVGRFVGKKRRGVTFRTTAGGRVRARSNALPGVFGRATKAKVRLRVRDASAEHPVTIRFDFLDTSGTPRWSQPVTFSDGRWKAVSLRLPGRDGVGQALLSPMRNVSSWGMSIEGRADVQVQRFELWRQGAPSAPPLGLAVLDYFTSEPAATQASRTVASSWLRGESPRIDTAFDGLLSLHRQMSSSFPGVPDIEEEAPITTSVHGGVQTLWHLAKSALDEPSGPTRSRKDTRKPGRPVLPLPWLLLPW